LVPTWDHYQDFLNTKEDTGRGPMWELYSKTIKRPERLVMQKFIEVSFNLSMPEDEYLKEILEEKFPWDKEGQKDE
jgi:hypothetical protein